MRIVIDGIIFELNPTGGVARLYREVLPRLCALDTLHIDLITERHLPIIEAPCINPLRLNPPIRRLIRPRRMFAPILPSIVNRALDRATASLRQHIWHSTYYTLPPRWTGAKVFTVYDMLYERYPHLFTGQEDRMHRREKQRCLRAADAILSISHATAADLQTYLDIDPAKIHIIPLAYSDVFRVLPEQSAHRDEPAPGQPPYLLYVGERRSYKGFDTLLEAYRGWKHNHNVKLIVVGREWSAAERRMLAAYGIAGSVELRRGVDDDALAQLYNKALAFVFPSLSEGFGIPLLEAAACGCPIVASRIPSTSEVMQDCPFYFEAGSAESLRVTLDQLVDSAAETARRVQQGIERASQYSWDRTARQTLDVYRTLR